jgi:hypothetical protein
MATVFLASSGYEYHRNQPPRLDLNRRGLPMASLKDLDLMCFGQEPVLLVCTVAKRHQRGPAAPAPGLNNFPVDDDKVGTILS